MVIPPLTDEQREAVSRLVSERRIEKVLMDARRAEAFLQSSADRVGQLGLLTSPVVTYDVAYDAAHDVGEALMSAYGYRTTNRPGQHQAVGLFLEAVFDKPPARAAARSFDRLRRARNQSHYEAAVVGRADAEAASRIAMDLLNAARSHFTACSPELP